jgi:hypothetical protein
VKTVVEKWVRKGNVQRSGRKVNIISFFDDNDDGEDDELRKPDLDGSKRGCEKALGSMPQVKHVATLC